MMNFLELFVLTFIAFFPTMCGSFILHFFYISEEPKKRSWVALYGGLIMVTAGIYTFLRYKGAF